MAKTEITTPIGRLMFPNLFRAEVPTNQNGQPTGGDPRYNCVLVFDAKAQQTEAYKKLAAAVKAEAEEYFKGQVPRTARNPLIKVSDTDYAQKYEGFNDGDVMIRPWSKFQPGIVDGRLQDITIESDVWAGQLFRATVTPAGYDNSGNKGVLLFLNNLQQAKADEPRMDGRKSAAASFEATEEMADAGSGDAGDFFN
jgi:hypothetical protein